MRRVLKNNSLVGGMVLKQAGNAKCNFLNNSILALLGVPKTGFLVKFNAIVCCGGGLLIHCVSTSCKRFLLSMCLAPPVKNSTFAYAKVSIYRSEALKTTFDGTDLYTSQKH